MTERSACLARMKKWRTAGGDLVWGVAVAIAPPPSAFQRGCVLVDAPVGEDTPETAPPPQVVRSFSVADTVGVRSVFTGRATRDAHDVLASDEFQTA